MTLPLCIEFQYVCIDLLSLILDELLYSFIFVLIKLFPLFIFFHLVLHTHADLLDRMGVWILDGVVWHSQLLPFVLTKNTIHHTTVMIVVDMSAPWSIMESLERWAEVVRKHIQTLQIPPKDLREMEEQSECVLRAILSRRCQKMV